MNSRFISRTNSGAYGTTPELRPNHFSRFFGPVLFDANDGGSAGTGGANPTTENPPANSTGSVKQAVQDAIAEILGAKSVNGDKDAALEVLVRKNHRLETSLEEAKVAAGKLPEATQAELEAYRALGKPDELKTRLGDGEAAIAERDDLKTEKIVADAAKLEGYKPDVLKDLAKSKDFRIEVRGEGDAKKAFALFKDGEKDVEKPLGEYAEGSLGSYLPALRAEQSAGGTVVNTALSGTGTPAKSDDPVERRIAQRHEEKKTKTNPLMVQQ